MGSLRPPTELYLMSVCGWIKAPMVCLHVHPQPYVPQWETPDPRLALSVHVHTTEGWREVGGLVPRVCVSGAASTCSLSWVIEVKCLLRSSVISKSAKFCGIAKIKATSEKNKRLIGSNGERGPQSRLVFLNASKMLQSHRGNPKQYWSDLSAGVKLSFKLKKGKNKNKKQTDVLEIRSSY